MRNNTKANKPWKCVTYIWCCSCYFSEERRGAAATQVEFAVWMALRGDSLFGTIACCYPDCLCRVGAWRPPGTAWSSVLPHQGPNHPRVILSDPHSERSAAFQPGAHGKRDSVPKHEVTLWPSACPLHNDQEGIVWAKSKEYNARVDLLYGKNYPVSDFKRNILSIWFTGKANAAAVPAAACT